MKSSSISLSSGSYGLPNGSQYPFPNVAGYPAVINRRRSAFTPLGHRVGLGSGNDDEESAGNPAHYPLGVGLPQPASQHPYEESETEEADELCRQKACAEKPGRTCVRRREDIIHQNNLDINERIEQGYREHRDGDPAAAGKTSSPQGIDAPVVQ
jgi:hypothetical protein